MPVVDRYIARNFLTGAAIVLFALAALFGFLALSEELEDVGKGAYTTLDAMVVVAYSLPKIMLDLLPVTALLGVLIGLGAMANHQELVIVRAVGTVTRRIALPLAEVTFGITIIVLLVQFFVIPAFELKAAQIRSKTTPQTIIASTESEFWTRSGNRFIRIGNVSQQGALGDVEVFDLGKNGDLKELIQASSVKVLDDGQWLLIGTDTTRLESSKVSEEHSISKLWQSSLSPKQTSALIVPVEAMAPLALYKYIRLLDKNDLDTHRYQVIFWQQLSLPIGLLAMTLLGIPFLMSSARHVHAGQRVAIGGSIGILFYLSEQMMGQLAILFNLSPAPSAMAPDVLLLILALLFLHRTD